MMILEDDYDFDFHYDGPPVMPLAASDRGGVVVYLGTLSKCLAPGLRLGYIVASLDVVQQLAAYRSWHDGQGDHALEYAVATLLDEGELQRHVKRARRTYHARRDALCRLLRDRLPQLSFEVPHGGMALWAHAPGIDTDAWTQRGRTEGVAFQPGRLFAHDDRPLDHVRIGFAACNERELAEAVERMVRALPA